VPGYHRRISGNFSPFNSLKEIAESGLAVQQFHLKDYIEEEFFETKQVVYVKG
jgi:hypothetical protein